MWACATITVRPGRSRARAIMRSARAPTCSIVSPPTMGCVHTDQPGIILADVAGAAALVDPVVPLQQVVTHDGVFADAGQVGGVPGPAQRADVDDGILDARHAGDDRTQLDGLAATCLVERDVRPSRVAPLEAPLRLAVTDEGDPGRCRLAHDTSARIQPEMHLDRLLNLLEETVRHVSEDVAHAPDLHGLDLLRMRRGRLRQAARPSGQQDLERIRAGARLRDRYHGDGAVSEPARRSIRAVVGSPRRRATARSRRRIAVDIDRHDVAPPHQTGDTGPNPWTAVHSAQAAA